MPLVNKQVRAMACSPRAPRRHIRVTRWDASGGLACDRKLNRPGTVAEIEAAIGAGGLAGN